MANLIADQGHRPVRRLAAVGRWRAGHRAAARPAGLRVSGEFLAVTTLAFAVAMQLYFLNPANYECCCPAVVLRPELFGASTCDERWLYALALALVAAVFVVHNLRTPARPGDLRHPRQRAGAAAAGINPVETRLAAFVLAGMFAGVAGGLHAITLRGIGLNTYQAPTACSCSRWPSSAASARSAARWAASPWSSGRPTPSPAPSC